MKASFLKSLILVSLFSAAVFVSCGDDDDDVQPSSVPEAVLEAFNQKQGDAKATWEKDGVYFKAELKKGGVEIEMWFTADGTWVRTETDFNGTLPAAVQRYLSSKYPGYVLEEVVFMETPAGSYYEIEFEYGGADMTDCVYADGTPVNGGTTTNPDDDDDDDTGSVAPKAVLKAFAEKFGDVKAEWEKDGSHYKAEFYEGYDEVDAWFTADGTWACTSSEYNGGIPKAVNDYIVANYDKNYNLDGVKFVETPTYTYYAVKVVRYSSSVTLYITPDGKKATPFKP